MLKIKKRFTLSLSKGFTLIELLIVIAVLGILAVAVLSAINPIEQMRKARDARRKSDAAELLNAYERYLTTFGCYPWERGTGSCVDTDLATQPPNFGASGNSLDLITQEELKIQFPTRDTIMNFELFVTEAINDQVSVCFVPESESARSGGLGPTMDQTNTTTDSICTDADACYVCVPQ